uniref:SRCR domain-containing protein n=1 Tax=Scleropages formosus TaxID=113540 RepID=A0A8C9W8G7_SCLFO
MSLFTSIGQLSLRLKGGNRTCSGRVELWYKGSWGTICDDLWDMSDAEVVCRQLGCGAAQEAHGNAAFGRRNGPIWLNEVKCRGDELHLLDCPHSLQDHTTSCSHKEDAGVTCEDSDVRLVNGNSPCEGRVEILHEGQWGTVCGGGWDINDASVVCRQVFCGDAVAAPLNSYFGAGTGKIWIVGVNCGGSESTLKDCGHGGWGNVYGYEHVYDAGVICSGTFTVRLAGGPHLCSGRLEFHHKGSWYTVCDPDFDLQDAKVVCRQLGCGTAVQVQGAAVFGKGDGKVWKNKVECRGDEHHFRQCLISSTKDIKCTHDTDVGLECFCKCLFQVLVDGPDSCSGRVELQYLTEWGTVCDASWDLRAANVLCQQLGCGSAVAVPGQAWFGNGRGRISVDVFECQGKEARLSQCAVSSWNRTPCSPGHDAGVICTGEEPLDQEHFSFCTCRYLWLYAGVPIKIRNEWCQCVILCPN